MFTSWHVLLQLYFVFFTFYFLFYFLNQGCINRIIEKNQARNLLSRPIKRFASSEELVFWFLMCIKHQNLIDSRINESYNFKPRFDSLITHYLDNVNLDRNMKTSSLDERVKHFLQDHHLAKFDSEIK
jgi:hypothetical protein